MKKLRKRSAQHPTAPQRGMVATRLEMGHTLPHTAVGELLLIITFPEQQ